jgi:hypothetical protein
MGYEFNPYEAGLTTVDTPKPAAILAEEKRIGKEMEPTYATFTAPRKGPGGGGGESVAYGPPTGYRYDDGQSQYVKFDSSGKYYETEKRKGDFDDALKMAALFAAITTGGASLGVGGAGAGAAGTAAAAFTPEMIAAGLTPGSIGAAGAASGALTGANLAAASGIGSLGAGALTGAAGTAALPASEVASLGSGAAGFTPEMIASGLTPGSIGASGAASGALTGANLAAASGIGSLGAGAAAIPSINEMIASGMSPGSAGATGAASGALTGAELAAATGTAGAGITSLAPTLAKSANEAIASGMSPGSVGADLASKGLLTAEQLAAAAGTTGAGITSIAPAAAKSVNEMVASGMSPGSAGAAGAASGALTPAQLAAAAGVVTEGATPALFELGRAGKGLPSANEAVASGLGPGSAGAKAAVDGTLTAQELAAAAGTAGALTKDGVGDLLTKAKEVVTDTQAKDTSSGSKSGMGILGLMALMSMMNKGGGAAPASTATIPELTATRTQLPYDVDKKGVNPNTPYRPGQGGVTYFSPTTYTPTPPKAAGGGLMSLGQSNLGSYSDGGRLLKGPGDGVSDSIPAIIGRKQPARLANGEFVIPARIVSELGNGSTDAGAKRLYEMMARVQKARRNTKNVAANTKAAKYLPA